jgi:F-type H+-transporting ATPase subunit b
MLEEAGADADQRRKDLFRKAREEIDKKQKAWSESVERQQETFMRDLKQMTQQQVYAIARRAFRDLADESVETRSVDAFLKRVEKLDQGEKDKITSAIGKSDAPVFLSSSFKLPSKKRQEIEKVLGEQLGDLPEIEFQETSNMILGIELRTKGRKIAWSLSHYLQSLEDKAGSVLEKVASGSKSNSE